MVSQMKPEKADWLGYTWRYFKAGLQSKVFVQKPIFLTVFVTARCGLNCGHCFYREELLNGDIHSELSLEEFRLFTERSPPFPKLIITGGEPFLRKDLAEIVEHFYHNQSSARQITIPTAGQHENDIVALTERVLASCPDLILELQLSLDGVAESHDKIRGKGQFERLMSTYNRLRPIQDLNQRLRLRFNFTFSAQTQDHFAETYNFVTQTLANPHFDMVLVRRTTIDPAYFVPADMEKYRAAATLLQAAERKKAEGLLQTLLAERALVEREIIADHYLNSLKMSGCQAGTLTAILSETGELRPCEILDTSFGNIRNHDYSIRKLWKNHRAEQHRYEIQSSKCFCTFETSVRTTMVFKPKWLAKSVKNALGRFRAQEIQ